MSQKPALRRLTFMGALIACLLVAGVASAQRVVVVEGGPVYDGPRLRAGISVGGGGLFLNGYGVGLVGLDGRIGVQINNLVAVYAQPYLALGGGGDGVGSSGFLTSVGADAVVDFTLSNVFFLGVGGGGGGFIAPQPTGGTAAGSAEQLLFRVGFYPIVARYPRRARRSGLMVGADVRPFFISGASLIQAMGVIGFEAF
jgi:hypothetical protein